MAALTGTFCYFDKLYIPVIIEETDSNTQIAKVTDNNQMPNNLDAIVDNCGATPDFTAGQFVT